MYLYVPRYKPELIEYVSITSNSPKYKVKTISKEKLKEMYCYLRYPGFHWKKNRAIQHKIDIQYSYNQENKL